MTQLQQQLVQLQQQEVVDDQRRLQQQQQHPLQPFPHIRLRLKSQPVVYHVRYSDVTTVGKVERRRARQYVYAADRDVIRRDWDKAVEEHADKHPVVYNRSAIKGSSYAMRVREKRKRKRFPLCCCKRNPKPAKIRKQQLKIVSEYPEEPFKQSFYEIDKKSKYPSVTSVHKSRSAYGQRRRQRRHPLEQRHPVPIPHYYSVQYQPVLIPQQ